MKFSLTNNTTFLVTFVYPEKAKHGGLSPHVDRRSLLLCVVKNNTTNDEVIGIAKLHPSDQYHGPMGRKIAFGNALTGLNLSKDDKAEMWAQYVKRVRVPVYRNGRLVSQSPVRDNS